MIGPIAGWVLHHPEEEKKILRLALKENTVHTRDLLKIYYHNGEKPAFLERVITYVLSNSPLFRSTNNHSKGTGRTFVRLNGCKVRERDNWREYCITCDDHTRKGCMRES